MSLPSYDAFRQALVDPALRAQIGLVISDPDAQSLAGNEEWARNYFDAWIAMAPAASAAPAASEAPTEAFAAAAPAQPFGAPAEPYAATQPYAAAPAQPQQGQPLQGAKPKKGLPGWALAVIIGGAALVLLGGVGIAALVISTLNDVQDNASASSQAAEPTEEPIPEETAPEDGLDELETPLPDFENEWVPEYSEADAAAYTAEVAPVFGFVESEYMDAQMIQDVVIPAGESICVALTAGYTEEQLAAPMVGDMLSEEDVQVLMDASRTYLCG